MQKKFGNYFINKLQKIKKNSQSILVKLVEGFFIGIDLIENSNFDLPNSKTSNKINQYLKIKGHSFEY